MAEVWQVDERDPGLASYPYVAFTIGLVVILWPFVLIIYVLERCLGDRVFG